ncbi:hypothetical protein RRG08_038248 [Elysia crispata]|uniref:Uncharacterized protein n=1 Tax=Elysia crispata TaxID=231223 RepID=A0AAE1E1R3_9GAST|nr:hypothetical protein RRG08_038248 [Elysia crispata]
MVNQMCGQKHKNRFLASRQRHPAVPARQETRQDMKQLYKSSLAQENGSSSFLFSLLALSKLFSRLLAQERCGELEGRGEGAGRGSSQKRVLAEVRLFWKILYTSPNEGPINLAWRSLPGLKKKLTDTSSPWSGFSGERPPLEVGGSSVNTTAKSDTNKPDLPIFSPALSMGAKESCN